MNPPHTPARGPKLPIAILLASCCLAVITALVVWWLTEPASPQGTSRQDVASSGKPVAPSLHEPGKDVPSDQAVSAAEATSAQPASPSNTAHDAAQGLAPKLSPDTAHTSSSGATAAALPARSKAKATTDDAFKISQIRSRGIASILRQVDMTNPTDRAQAVSELARLDKLRLQSVRVRAEATGIPIRLKQPDGAVAELVDFEDNGEPLYRTTFNTRAAISTAADLVARAVVDGGYGLDGSGLTLGIWDAGWVRGSHQEFQAAGSAVTYGDAANYFDDHGTHVGGTMVAAGVVPRAKGMAPKAKLRSYDWNADDTEMLAGGAVAATNTALMPISNHSYGIIARSEAMGVYHRYAADMDAVAFSTPYYLQIWAAGNDQDRLRVWSGYQSLHYYQTAKNTLVVGAVSDAVAYGERAVRNATMSDFSSWGPTDDGRIKPDVVGNGVSVYSPVATGNSAYDGTYSGTSMAAPNVAGSAALLVQQYVREFGVLPRADLLKALLIHTADDLGNPGPDYQFGWGLVNTKAAAALIAQEDASPGTVFFAGTISNAVAPALPAGFTNNFAWDGVSAIKATLVWTDPEGAPVTATDSRSNNLVHNLDLRIVDPAGSTNQPFVMPFVGAWTYDSMGMPAVRGKNDTDNVEQVVIAASNTAAGTYRLEVTLDGPLTLPQQDFYIVLTGAGTTPANLPPTISLDLPGDGQTYAPYDSVTLTATASDRDGSVSFVRFIVEEAAPGTNSVTAPAILAAGKWTAQWTPPTSSSSTPGAGRLWKVRAEATDNFGAKSETPRQSFVVDYAVPGEVGSFLPPEFNDHVQAMATDHLGRFYLGGKFTTVDDAGVERDAVRLVRLGETGSVDTTYSSAMGPDSQVRALQFSRLHSALYVGGDFAKVGTNNRVALARFHIGSSDPAKPDGTLDAGFAPVIAWPESSNPPHVRAILVQDDGKIVIGGRFTRIGGVARKNLARLNPDGTLDMSFVPEPNSAVNSLVLLPGGKILAGGQFSTIAGVTSPGLIRLNGDGTRDASFSVGGGVDAGFNGPVHSVAVAADGSVYAGGLFSSYQGRPYYNNLAKLSGNGSIVGTFNFTPGLNGAVHHVHVQPGGEVLVAGEFTQAGNNNLKIPVMEVGRVAQFLPTGEIDETFNVAPEGDGAFSAGADGPIYTASPLGDGSVLLGGGFRQFNSEPRDRLAVIAGLDTLTPVVTSRSFSVLNAGGDLDYTFTSSAPQSQAPDAPPLFWVDPSTPLPRGVELDAATGRLTGVPLDHGEHRIIVNVTSRLGTSSMPFDLYVGNVPVPYDRWAKAWFKADHTNTVVAGPAVVRNAAGLQNLFVYALDGGNPHHATPSMWPQMSFMNDGGKTYAVLSAGKYGAAEVSRTFEWSDTLGSWSSASNAIVPLPDPAVDRIQARGAKSTDEAPKQFLRLRISNP